MTYKDIVSHIKSANELISNQQTLLKKYASENAELKSRENSPAFDEAALRKIANDVHVLYGSPSNIAADQLVDLWKSNPSTLLGTMQKLASAQLSRVATGDHLGSPNNKEPRAPQRREELDADAEFRQKYE